MTELFKLLSDETRLRIMNLLFEKDLCVCELTELLSLSQPKVSKHIAKIRALHFVKTKRNEQYIYYSLDRSNPLLNDLMEFIKLHSTEDLKNDLKLLMNKTSFVCGR